MAEQGTSGGLDSGFGSYTLYLNPRPYLVSFETPELHLNQGLLRSRANVQRVMLRQVCRPARAKIVICLPVMFTKTWTTTLAVAAFLHKHNFCSRFELCD